MFVKNLFSIKKAILAFFLIVPFVLAGCTTNKTESQAPVTLTVWNPIDSDTIYKGVIDSYQQSHPNVTINYKKRQLTTYKSSVVSRVTGGKADVETPDVFLLHNTWTPELVSILSPMPTSVYSADDYKKTFYPSAVASLTSGKNVVGVPAYFDGLALFINTDLVGDAVPSTWSDLQTSAAKVATVDLKSRNVNIGGVALGTADNIDHFSDILSLMMLQNGVADIKSINTSVAGDGRNLGQDALTFYAEFAQGTNKVWDESMPPSTTAFATGRLGYYFGPSWRVLEFKNAQSKLKFKVVPVPQLSVSTTNWASFWAWGVSSKSPNTAAAWEFVKYLSSADVQKKVFAETVKSRGMGQPYARVDLASSIKSDPNLGPFTQMAPTAKSMPSAWGTSDGGFVDSNVNYLKDAVNAMAKGNSASSALETAAAGINQNFANLTGKK